MQEPRMLLISLRSAGFTLRAESGKLIVSPASQLTPEQRDAIVANKPALMALVQAEGGEVTADLPFHLLPSPECLWGGADMTEESGTRCVGTRWKGAAG